MENNNFFSFNPYRYKNYLSPFGQNVLDILLKQWRSRKNCTKNIQNKRVPQSQERKILYFRDTHSNRSIYSQNSFQMQFQPPAIENTSNENKIDFHDSQDIEDILNISNLIETNSKLDDVIRTPSREDLIIPMKTNDQLLNPVDKDISVNNNNIDNVSWNDMFEELIPEINESANISNIVLSIARVPSKETESPHINFSNDDKIQDKDKSEQGTVNNKTSLKRKHSAINDRESKQIKVTSNPFRKQKSSKVIKNWLKDVDLNNAVQEYDVDKKNENLLAKTIVTKGKKGKQNKKTIQAQLANKNGVMKFDKPKINLNEDIINSTSVIDEQTDVQTISEAQTSVKIIKVVKESKSKPDKGKLISKENETPKDKKIKSKFLAPIKSQVPVRDVSYDVTIKENGDLKILDTLRVRSEEITMMLVYSNGFCQLNNQHTDDSCVPEGLMMCFNNKYYYLKGVIDNFTNILQDIFENNIIVVYEGKTILMYLNSEFQITFNNKLNIIDTKIGGSLIDPDNPPENFSELHKILSFTPEFTIATESVMQKSAWYLDLLKQCVGKLKDLLMETSLWNVFVDIEMGILPIIAEMEQRGVTVNLELLKSMEEVLLKKMNEVEQECYKAAGKVFQINSTVQVRAIIYDELKLDSLCNLKVTETISKGAKSTSEAMLRSLSSAHELPRLVLEYRQLHKARATFLAGITHHVRGDVVKPTWVQTAASTGRIASNNPNLQAIPKVPFGLVMFPEPGNKEESPLNFRSVYVPREGYTLLAADFRHVECRVFAQAAADTQLLAALRAGGDLFRALAATWLRKPEECVSEADRERTKRIVYASMYGAGARKLMDILDVGYDQALAISASFNRTFPALKEFGRAVVSRCAGAGGRLTTPCGRTRSFKHIASPEPARRAQAERQAVNFIIQGSAADLCKLAMVETMTALRGHCPPVEARLLLQIHDELVWEVVSEQLHTAAALVQTAMEGSGRRAGLASLPVALSVGRSWGHMRPYTVSST